MCAEKVSHDLSSLVQRVNERGRTTVITWCGEYGLIMPPRGYWHRRGNREKLSKN